VNIIRLLCVVLITCHTYSYGFNRYNSLIKAQYSLRNMNNGGVHTLCVL